MVRFFLTLEDVDVNLDNGGGAPLLSIIIFKGDRELARILFARKDVKVNTSKTGFSPLVSAIAKNDLAMAQLLLQHGADIHSATTMHTPLMTAVSINNTAAVRVLLRHAQVVSTSHNAVSEAVRAEVLAAAIYQGDEEIATLLLEHSDASQLSESKATTLWIIADSSEQGRVADLLLEHNAPVTLDSKEGIEALMTAVRHGQVAAVDRLVKHDANINRCVSLTPPTPPESISNFSPLQYAASCEDLEILDLLEKMTIHAVKQPCGPTVYRPQGPISMGSLALQESTRYGHEQVFEYLWDCEALNVDVNQQDFGPWHQNRPFLGTAAAQGRLSIGKKIVGGA